GIEAGGGRVALAEQLAEQGEAYPLGGVPRSVLALQDGREPTSEPFHLLRMAQQPCGAADPAGAAGAEVVAAPEFLCGLPELARPHEHNTEVPVRLGVTGPESEGLPVRSDRLVPQALVVQGDAEVVVGAGGIRLE